MKIAYVIPGTGEAFYCQNCFRDNELLKSLQSLGNEVCKIPMYLPSDPGNNEKVIATPVFYGAVNVFLREKIPFYKHCPLWLEQFFDSPMFLNLAAKKTGSTRAAGLEEMTISLLQGEKGRQALELDHLIEYIKAEIDSDVVHLSNALLLGLAHRIKHDLGKGVVCSLQDEHEWVDMMGKDYQEKVWNLMAEKAVDVDMFVTGSQFYSEKSQIRLNIPPDKIKVIYGGVNFDGYEKSPLAFDPPVIGYLNRLSKHFGLEILVDAWIRVKKDSRFKDLKLFLTGGYTSDDKEFVKRLSIKIEANDFCDDFRIVKPFDKPNRVKFLKSLTLLSVPVLGGDAFGTYQAESLGAGVPIVQPNVGCYPEFIEATNGGILYEPNDSEHLAKAIESLLADPEKVRKLGEQGRQAVLSHFSMCNMAENISGVYEGVKKRLD